VFARCRHTAVTVTTCGILIKLGVRSLYACSRSLPVKTGRQHDSYSLVNVVISLMETVQHTDVVHFSGLGDAKISACFGGRVWKFAKLDNSVAAFSTTLSDFRFSLKNLESSALC